MLERKMLHGVGNLSGEKVMGWWVRHHHHLLTTPAPSPSMPNCQHTLPSLALGTLAIRTEALAGETFLNEEPTPSAGMATNWIPETITKYIARRKTWKQSQHLGYPTFPALCSLLHFLMRGTAYCQNQRTWGKRRAAVNGGTATTNSDKTML